MIRLMIVEDELIAAKHCAKCINSYGYQFVVTALCRNKLEAFAAFKKDPPDVIFTDIRLGKDDGLEIVQEFRNQGWAGKLVIMTVHKNFDFAIKAIHLEVEDYLLKPIFCEDVAKILDKILIAYESKGDVGIASKIIHKDRTSLPQYIDKALIYISLHYQEQISLTKIAEYASVSSTYLSAGFKKHIDLTFIEYLNLYRLEVSKRILLDTDLPLEQIALKVGISEVAYYNRLFKRFFSISPGKYRKHGHENKDQE